MKCGRRSERRSTTPFSSNRLPLYHEPQIVQVIAKRKARAGLHGPFTRQTRRQARRQVKNTRRGICNTSTSRRSRYSYRCYRYSGSTRSRSDPRSAFSDKSSTTPLNGSSTSRPWICSTRTGYRRSGGLRRSRSSRAGRLYRSWPMGRWHCHHPCYRSSS